MLGPFNSNGYLALCYSSAAAASQPSPAGADSAKKLFQAGKFPEAAEVYSQILAHNSQDDSAIVQLGRIALLSNRLTDAQNWFQKAFALQPGDTDTKVMLAEAFYRGDDFEKAAETLDGIDVSTNQLIISQYPTLNTAKIASFKGQTPYELHGNGESTRLKFVKSDVLPVVTVRVNGGEEVTFFIDTGNSEVALDTDFAREIGAQLFGAVQGTFSGGEHTQVENGRTDSITVGDWTVKNLPVVVLPLRQLSGGLGVKRIDGCIGTNLLYHFLATLDNRHGELVLRRKTAKGSNLFAATPSGKLKVLPFWIAGDHFMVGWGRVETLPPTLLFVDTGLAGAGSQIGGISYQTGQDYARERQSEPRFWRGRQAYHDTLRRAAPFVRQHAGKQRSRSVRWSVPVGRAFWLSSRRDGRPRFLPAVFSDL